MIVGSESSDARKRAGPCARHEVEQFAIDGVDVLVQDVMQRRRHQASAAQRDRHAHVHIGAGREPPVSSRNR